MNAMFLYPAIDLKDGRCVRLLRGDLAAATIFNNDPADQALQFQGQGCRWLHVVDLDGAVLGRPANEAAVTAILAAVTVPVQLGGGIRDMARIDTWLAAGLSRVILGTVALTNPQLVRDACQRHPGKIAIGIDARDGRVATEGWLATSDITAIDLARALEDAGAAALIYTDIDRDGAMGGVNAEATLALAEAVSTPVIASGGVSSMDDLARLKTIAGHKLAGVISGRALYDGRINIAAANALLEAA